MGEDDAGDVGVFGSLETATAWFEEQTPMVRSAMVNRAALRVMANIHLTTDVGSKWLVLTALRCNVISAARRRRPLR